MSDLLREDLDFRVLESLCCEPLSFMWDNSLLSAREEWFDAGFTKPGITASMCFIMGFRVRRQFMFFRRDEILYKCPFCNRELVIPFGYVAGDGNWVNPAVRLAMGVPVMKISESMLKKELAATKRACKGRWPPKD